MRKELTLRERLVRHFQRNHTSWIPSGEIQRLVVHYTTQTPRTCVRRLQEMAEEGILERKLVKGHTHYKLAEARTANEVKAPTPTSAKILEDNQKLLKWFDNYQPSPQYKD